jgi:hypothetical protein
MARKPKGTYTPAPEGLHQAVCCDVWEPWTEERPQQFGGGLVDKTRLVWVIEEVNPATQRPYEVSQIYTLSLHEKSKLCQHLESWRGRRFTDEEKSGFDLEKLIGANGQLQVVHKIKENSDTFANVQAIVPLGKGQTKLRVPADYIRRKDRATNGHDSAEPETISDDGVPF